MIKSIPRYKYLSFSLLCGVLATFWKYQFGVGDQLDHLLFVYKNINPDFLNNDPYVQWAGEFSVRYYFAIFIGLLASLLSVKAVYFGLTLFVNSVLAIYTHLVAVRLSKGVQLSGVVAAILVLTLTTINMGDVYTLYATGLSPDRLTFVLVIMAFYSLFMNRPIRAALLCGIGAMLHILLGAVGGFIILFAWFVAVGGYKKVVFWKKFILSVLLLFLFTLPTLVPMFGQIREQIAAQEFLDIYAFFRVPHHLVASTIFSTGIGIRSIAFFMAAGTAGYLLYKQVKSLKAAFIFCAIIALLILFLCLLGYFLLEIFPMRFAAMLQAFRYLTLLKWISLVLIGAYAGLLLNSKTSLVRGIYVVLSGLSPLLMAATMGFELVRTHLPFKQLKRVANPWLWIMLVGFCLVYKIYNPETIVLVILLGLTLALNYGSKRIYIGLIATYLIFVLINILALPGIDISNKPVNRWLSENYRPVFNFGDANSAVNQLCNFVEDSTPENALFITPPNLLEIRTIGKRASLVSFKAVPFTDVLIRKWKADIDFCYGATQQLGFNAELELMQNYKKMTDEHLLAIFYKYGNSHAVLFNETKTSFGVIYSNAEFKVVSLY